MSNIAPSILGIDVGTSSLKAVLYSIDGQIISIVNEKYSYETCKTGWAEIDPEVWWEAFKKAMTSLRKSGISLDQIQSIAFTGQMHSAVLLDRKDNVICPSILWLDRRAIKETEELQSMFQIPLYQLNSTYTISKLLWIYKNRNDITERISKIIWPKDFLRWKMTGQYYTDRTEAYGSGLYDWEKNTWAIDRIAAVGLKPKAMPTIQPASHDGGTIHKHIADELGFSESIKVVIGMGDMAALIGGAPPKQGRVVCSLGSSSMIFTTIESSKIISVPNDALYKLNMENYHLFGGVSSTTGAAIMWFYENILSGLENKIEFNEWIHEALEIEPGSDGVCFIPYLTGERSPYWSDDIRGGFYGLKLSHDKRHLARAVLEGIAYSLKHLLDLYEESGVIVKELALAAGGIRTPGLLQIIADVCQKDVFVYAGQETVTRVLFALSKENLGLGNFENNLMSTFNKPEIVNHSKQNKLAYEKVYSNYLKFSKFASSLN
ncbi:MAG: hypothetical protein APF76_06380 [Desulfitibacter sp. BRH_c19]|nr:MAG: hypothetical protein APF76_06380 [Desulfitibacter sp. BRH_c19]